MLDLSKILMCQPQCWANSKGSESKAQITDLVSIIGLKMSEFQNFTF